MYPIGIRAFLDDIIVQTVFGNPLRVYPFGEAPANPTTPYAVHRLVSGVPGLYVDAPPVLDDERVQFSVYADTVEVLGGAVRVLRNRLEEGGHVISYVDLGRDPETLRYGIALDWTRVDAWPEPDAGGTSS